MARMVAVQWIGDPQTPAHPGHLLRRAGRQRTRRGRPRTPRHPMGTGAEAFGAGGRVLRQAPPAGAGRRLPRPARQGGRQPGDRRPRASPPVGVRGRPAHQRPPDKPVYQHISLSLLGLSGEPPDFLTNPRLVLDVQPNEGATSVRVDRADAPARPERTAPQRQALPQDRGNSPGDCYPT